MRCKSYMKRKIVISCLSHSFCFHSKCKRKRNKIINKHLLKVYCTSFDKLLFLLSYFMLYLAITSLFFKPQWLLLQLLLLLCGMGYQSCLLLYSPQTDSSGNSHNPVIISITSSSKYCYTTW